MTEWLTVAAVAQRLDVTERTVRDWLRKGKLVGHNMSGQAGWRVDAENVDRFVRGEPQKNAATE